MSRRVILAAAVLGAVAILLIVTGGEPSATETVTTVDGVTIEIPRGWQAGEELPFVYRELESTSGDSFTVALTCGEDGCKDRTLAEWVALSDSLPTFATTRSDPADLFETVEETRGDNWIQSRATTYEGATQVAVAVFADQADRYLECVSFSNNLSSSVTDTLAESCRNASLPSAAPE